MELCNEEELVRCGKGLVREVTSVRSDAAGAPGFRRLSRDTQPGKHSVSDGRSSAPALHYGTQPGTDPTFPHYKAPV